MIRIAHRPELHVPEDLAARIVSAIATGNYRTVTMIESSEEEHDVDPGATEGDTSDDVPDFDLQEAASVLRWFPDEAHPDDSTDMPDLRFGDGVEFWIDHDAIAPDAPQAIRIAEAGRIKADMAARILACPAATQLEWRATDVFHHALAASCGTEDEDRPFCVDAATPWSVAVVGAVEDVVLKRHSVQPASDLLRVAPHAAEVWIVRNTVIHFESYRTYLNRDEDMTVMEALRILAKSTLP